MYLFIKTSILNGFSELGIFLTDGDVNAKIN